MRSGPDLPRCLQPRLSDISVMSAYPASDLDFSRGTKSAPPLFLPLS